MQYISQGLQLCNTDKSVNLQTVILLFEQIYKAVNGRHFIRFSFQHDFNKFSDAVLRVRVCAQHVKETSKLLLPYWCDDLFTRSSLHRELDRF